jgi:hypothetical protein
MGRNVFGSMVRQRRAPRMIAQHRAQAPVHLAERPTHLRLAEDEFHDLRGSLVEAAQSEPLRSRTHVGQPAPGLSVASVRKSKEMALLEALEFGPSGSSATPSVLDCPLVTVREPANHERHRWVLPEVGGLARRILGVEEDLQIVGHDKADQGTWGEFDAETEAWTASE